MTTLTAFYDLAVGPVSFDCVTFLVKAELHRRKCGAARLHVVFVPDPKGPGGFRDKSAFYDEHEARWRFWNICVPACALIGASVTVATDWEQARRLRTEHVFPHDWDRQTLKDRRHLVGDLIAAAKAGDEIPMLSASAHARRKVRGYFDCYERPVVTMTLRTTYLPERNAPLEEWGAAQQHIEDCGYGCKILEDTSAALEQGVGYGELNLDLRMAMYQEAALNLQANNGAASLCWFSEKPYRMFGAGVPADEWDGLFVKQGLPLGATWPWAKREQKIVYGPTTAKQLIAEFEAWRESAS